MSQQANITAKKVLIFFLGFYFILWGILPCFFLKSVYLDSAENLALSHVLSWSYSKHPPLGMWVIHYFDAVFNNNQAATFLASASCLIASLYYIYKISLRFLAKNEAIAATLLSSLSSYFLVHFALQFNQNTIMLPFWVASIYYFLKVMDNNRLRDWVVLAIVCFLGVIAKYETLVIIALEFLYLCVKFNRKFWLGIIVAIGIFLALLSPHLLWLWNHHFYPIQFLLSRTNSTDKNQLMVFYGAFIVQPLNITLAVLVLICLLKMKKLKRHTATHDTTWRNPLIFLATTPWVLFCVLSVFISTKPEWGYPLLALSIPAIFYLFNIQCHQIKAVGISVCLLHTLILTGYLLITFFGEHRSGINWPSYTVATTAESFWDKHHMHASLDYVGGSERMVYYLGAYLPTHPEFLKRNNFDISPWVNKSGFYKKGAIFIDEGCNNATTHYKQLGFNVIAKQCFTVDEANKFQPSKMKFTLYLIGPGSRAAAP